MKKIFFITVALLSFWGCNQQNGEHDNTLQTVNGNTMGTYYSIKYYGAKSYKKEIDSLLQAVNQSVSTYIPSSVISQVNQPGAASVKVDAHFKTNFSKAKEVYKKTNGSFNPAVMPLVNYWGFGYERLTDNRKIDSAKVNSLLQLADFNGFELRNDSVYKNNPDAELDFSALAKGYGVDVVGDFLTTQNISSFLVEIGGEVVARGKKENGEVWTVGIRKPSTDVREKNTVVQAIHLENEAMATSGNYENYKEIEGEKTISHTIHPQTGFPQQVNAEILSSTVIAADCMTADAYATAFKVMGFQKSKQFVENQSAISVYFIYLNEENEVTTWTNLTKEDGLL